MSLRSKTCAIPQRWISDVAEILKRGSEEEIEWTDDAMLRWQVYGLHTEAYAPLLKVLVPGLVGKKVTMPNDEGPTYSFFFWVREDRMYGKICLTTDGRVIIIYSAHKANRETL